MDSAADSDGDHCCKVGRVAAAYDIADVDEQLRADRADGAALRELADQFNRLVFERAIETHAPGSFADPVLLYEGLTDDAASPGRKTELRTKVRQAGVPIDTVEDQFVSHVTMRSHFQSCLSIDTSREESDPANARDTIEWMQSKAETVIDQRLARLREMGELATGPLTVTQTVHVRCEDCGELYRLQDLLENEACACETDAPESTTRSS